jgi:hypothetical protein
MTKLRQLPETTLRRYKDRNGWFLEVVDDRGFPENIGDVNSEAARSTESCTNLKLSSKRAGANSLRRFRHNSDNAT